MHTNQEVCSGCNKPASFQCPLCQAENNTDKGFFCDQKCFAKNWLSHRDTFHKKAVVRAKQPQQMTTAGASEGSRKRPTVEAQERSDHKRKKKQKIEKAKSEKDKETQKSTIFPWCPLPAPKSMESGAVTPPMQVGVVRAVVGSLSPDSRTAFWSAAVAASHHIFAELEQLDGAKKTNILVITSGPLAAHATAWALRCANLARVMRLVVNFPENGDTIIDPSTYFCGNQHVVITTQNVARHVADGSASCWFSSSSNNLLVTLPGVTDASDFQSVNTRAIFFVDHTNGKGSVENCWFAEEEINHNVLPLKDCPVELHSIFDGTMADYLSTDEEKAVVMPKRSVLLFDNDVSTSLLRGDLVTALQHLVCLYSTNRGVFEEVFVNSFLASLGAASVTHFHHILAYAVRYLVDHSSRFSAPQGATLKEMSLRAVVKVVRLVAPIVSSEDETAKKLIETSWASTLNDGNYSSDKIKSFLHPSAIEKKKYFNYYNSTPNLQLQATVCYLYDHVSSGILDAICMAWGIKHVVKGLEALKVADKKRVDAVKRLQNRYGAKLGQKFANFLVVLMHFLYDAVAGYSLAVEDVERRTLWSITLEGEVGSLRSFLSNCFLLQEEKTELLTDPKKVKITSLSSRNVAQKQPNIKKLLCALPVRTASPEEPLSLPHATVPLADQRQREVERLRQQAVEEILMAMPRTPRPMYIGDVGNLIGKWFRFNARFDGVLGVSLMEFLMQNTGAFRVVGNLVTRRTAGVSDPVKIRFDQDDSADDDDDDIDSSRERKAKDRALLTGGKNSGGNAKQPSARMRKKNAAKMFNKSRFNRNYKPFDPAAKVPGYVKHGPRKIKGRGRKANKRNTKRG